MDSTPATLAVSLEELDWHDAHFDRMLLLPDGTCRVELTRLTGASSGSGGAYSEWIFDGVLSADSVQKLEVDGAIGALPAFRDDISRAAVKDAFGNELAPAELLRGVGAGSLTVYFTQGACLRLVYSRAKLEVVALTPLSTDTA